MADEPTTEIFDDLYLGLRAGGALRKQRRGVLLACLSLSLTAVLLAPADRSPRLRASGP